MAAHSTEQKRPQPLLTRAQVVTAITVLTALLVKVGLGQVADVLDRYEDPIAGLVLAAAPLVTAFLARRHVTPKTSPQDDDGNDLVPAGSTQDADAAARAALAQAEAEASAVPSPEA
jgi:hypothetical protein